MTKEDALFFLRRFRTEGINEKLYDALGVAIEALNTQTKMHENRTETHACDLIDRQAALDALEKIDCSDGVGISSLKCDAVDDAVTAIKALPSAQPTDAEIQRMQDIEQAALEKAYECGKQDAQRWIPCGERLPEPGVNVLVDVADIPAGGRFPLIDKICEDGEWLNCDGSEWLALAWMPIPKPWEGEEHG